MQSRSEKEQTWLRDVFDRSTTESVTLQKEECGHPEGEKNCSLTGRRCVFNEGRRR